MHQDAINSYFSKSGSKALLGSIMYNFYTRRITDYKIFLVKLFPMDSVAEEERKTLSEYMKNKNRRTKKSRRKGKIGDKCRTGAKVAYCIVNSEHILENRQPITTAETDENASETHASLVVNVIYK